MKTVKELEAEKDFIILRASNYHYDLGVQHERERIRRLIDEFELWAKDFIKTKRVYPPKNRLILLKKIEELKSRIIG